MFYSNDLLGKKSPLGAIWIAAHQPRKLNKARLMSINVSDTCNKIMDAEVPQALRLQAILVGGVVIVFNKQSMILLEDAQEMLRRLRAASNEEAAKVTLEEGKRQAKMEAITLGMPELDMAGPLDLAGLFPTFPTQLGADLLLPMPGADPQQQLGEDLFLMPSLPEDEEGGGGPGRSAGGGSALGRGRSAKQQQQQRSGSRGRLALEAVEPELNLDLGRHDLHLMDNPETFDVPDLGLGLPGAEGEPPLAEFAVPDDLFLMPELDQQQPQEQPAEDQQQQDWEQEQLQQGSEGQQAQAPRSSTPETTSEKPDSSGGAAPRTQKRRKKRIARTVVVDDLDSLLIKGSVYRQWQNDRSDLAVVRPQRPAPAQVAGAGTSLLAAGPATAALLPSGAWPPVLEALFKQSTVLLSASKAERKGKRSEAIAGEQEAEHQQQEGMEQPGRQEEEADGLLPLYDLAGAEYGELPLMGAPEPDLLLLPGEEEAFADGNPFSRRGGRLGRGAAEGEEEEDIETERLRAALNNPTDPEYYNVMGTLGLTPASLGGGPSQLAGSKRTASGGLRRESEGALAGLLSEGKSSDGRRSAGRLGLADLHEGVPYDGREEDLAGMLPVVGEDEPFVEEEGAAAAAAGSRDAKRTRRGAAALTEEQAAAGGSGSMGQALGATGTYGTLSQFELLEESNRQTQQLAVPPKNMSRHSHALINVLRGRFLSLESQGAEQAQLSLDQMCERLTRREAAKLFSQFLVLASNNFVVGQQAEPYGDILLTRGPFL